MPFTVLAVLLIVALSPLDAVAEQDFNCEEGRHNYVAVLSIPPTETENGEVHYVCMDCGLEWTDILYAISHVWGPWMVRIEATCDKPGELYRVCENGVPHYEFEESPALGHDYVEEGSTEPDCETEGRRTFICTRCGDSYTESIPALGHIRVETIISEPSCETEGEKAFICTRCGDSYSEPIPALEHEYEMVITAAKSCELQGVKTYTCSICGDSYTEIIPAGQHEYVIINSTEPACETEGQITYKCTICNDSYTELIPALGHEFGAWYVETPSGEGLPGVEARVCVHDASHKETRVLPALPVPLPPPPPPPAPSIDVVETVIEGVDFTVFAVFAVLLFPYFRWLFFIYKRKKAVEEVDERKKAVAERYEFD